MRLSTHIYMNLPSSFSSTVSFDRLSETKPFRRSTSSLMWWLQANTVTEIDRTVTMPSKGYSDLHHYYNDATYIHQLSDSITTPFLCLTAKNDPFVPAHCIPGQDIAADNENIFIVNTAKVGGHIGFWLPGRGCWATKACLSFFDSVVSTSLAEGRFPFLCVYSKSHYKHFSNSSIIVQSSISGKT